ncbi:MAG: hypothetical protein V4591_06670 [Bdellovibrionota bacterium]
MTSPISRISGSTPVSPLNRTESNSSSSLANFKISFHESFEFPHKKLTIKEESNTAVAAEERPLYWTLVKLFLEILQSGIDIVPTQPSDAGGYAVEAFFRPPEGLGVRSAIHLPLPIRALGKKIVRAPSGGRLSPAFIKTIEEYVEKVVNNFTNEQVLRLVIVASHEFGHYQSYVRGNHDENLKKGLYLFQRKYHLGNKADEFTWLVFREECQAWKHAEIFLRKTEFRYWEVYEEVKNGSLKTYFDSLNLTNASLDTYYKLSFLGDDFKKNSPSNLFKKEGGPRKKFVEQQESSLS